MRCYNHSLEILEFMFQTAYHFAVFIFQPMILFTGRTGFFPILSICFSEELSISGRVAHLLDRPS